MGQFPVGALIGQVDYFRVARDTPAIGNKGNGVSNFPQRDFWPGITVAKENRGKMLAMRVFATELKKPYLMARFSNRFGTE